MKIKDLFSFFNSFKGFLIISFTGVLVGSACALFLTTLEWITTYREHHTYIIFGLPIAGLIIGLVYHYYGKEVSAGNNFILEQYNQPTQKLPIKMGVLIYLSTLLTHLVGGSAGREGAAIQIGTSIADQFSDVFKISKSDRKIILLLGISSGFAAVFGTPLAGAVFALELLYFSKISIKSILPVVFVAYIADFTVKFWNVQHTIYHVKSLSKWEFQTILWLILAGIIFGLASFLFVKSSHFFAAFFTKTISFPPFRPFIGGLMLLIIYYFIDLNNYQGLGIPIILNSFEVSSNWYVFLIKIALTALTLGSGFKGGEVTPLFFVGATLGSALFVFVPLPISLLVGIGFVAVFAGATNTPIACTIMGIELFGIETSIYMAIGCFIAYLFSGAVGIYKTQAAGGIKFLIHQKIASNKNKSVAEL